MLLLCFVAVNGISDRSDAQDISSSPEPLEEFSTVQDMIQLRASRIQLEEHPSNHVTFSPKVQAIDERFSPHVADTGQEDTRNLSALWQMILAKNPIIQYGLKQLATPPELRYAHASAMSRTVSGLLSGASMLPYAMGADQYTAGATMMSSNLVEHARVESKKIDPNKLPSDTELVELAGIVQSLQRTMVESYFHYKTSLASWSQQEQLKNQLQTMPVSGASDQHLWHDYLVMQTNEHALLAEQEAKRYYLNLERLVGPSGMRTLHFEMSSAQLSAIPQDQIHP